MIESFKVYRKFMALIPEFNIEKIKHGTDKAIFDRAVKIYENEKVTELIELLGSYSAVVIGTHPYNVSIEGRSFKIADCTCYLGENNIICKHIVALAIYAIYRGKTLPGKDIKRTDQPTCSGIKGTTDKNRLSSVKKSITKALRLIKPYEGPSRIWFNYQYNLEEGCRYLASIFSELPVSYQTAQLVIDTLLKLDDRICRGGIDDSNGTVGGFIEESVIMLLDYAKINPSCIRAFDILAETDTCFGWEEPLLELIKN